MRFLFHEKIRENGTGNLDGEGFAEALMALVWRKLHFLAEGRSRGFVYMEIREERNCPFAIVDTGGHAAASGRIAGKGGLPDGERRPLKDDEARSCGDPCA